MNGEDWAILGIAVAGGAGLGYAAYTLLKPSNATTTPTANNGLPISSTIVAGTTQTGSDGNRYIAVAGKNGLAWVRVAPSTLTATPSGATWPQCGTTYMLLGTAYPASAAAGTVFAPYSSNTGVATYINGTLNPAPTYGSGGYYFQSTPAGAYGTLSGGYACS